MLLKAWRKKLALFLENGLTKLLLKLGNSELLVVIGDRTAPGATVAIAVNLIAFV
jgi:hypothetical protein